MNVGIRRVGIAVTALMLLLVAQLTYLQVVDAKTLAHDPRNGRDILKDLRAPLSSIISAFDQILPGSKPRILASKPHRVDLHGVTPSRLGGD